MNDRQKTVLVHAINHFGVEANIDKALEEMGELIGSATSGRCSGKPGRGKSGTAKAPTRRLWRLTSRQICCKI